MDITERKQAEKALVESERFARAALDSLTSHVAILDKQGAIVATNIAVAGVCQTERAGSGAGRHRSELFRCVHSRHRRTFGADGPGHPRGHCR